MKQSFRFPLACAAAMVAAQCFAGFCLEAGAQPVVRVKAKLTAFDGEIMTLTPLPAAQTPAAKGVPPAAEPFTVAVLPQTRYVGSDKTWFAAIKVGDYVGAAVTEGRGGTLRAQEVYLYDEALRGTGEGRFPEAGRLIVNGAVSAMQPTGPDDKQDGTLTVHYRGALLTGLGRGRTLCEGRASPPAYASPMACAADATIEVLPGTAVSALTVGDKSLLVPGALVTVAMTKGPDDKNVAPGVIVEKTAIPVTVEKPQSSP